MCCVGSLPGRPAWCHHRMSGRARKQGRGDGGRTEQKMLLSLLVVWGYLFLRWFVFTPFP